MTLEPSELAPAVHLTSGLLVCSVINSFTDKPGGIRFFLFAAESSLTELPWRKNTEMEDGGRRCSIVEKASSWESAILTSKS